MICPSKVSVICSKLCPFVSGKKKIDDDRELSQQRNAHSVVFPSDGIHSDRSHQAVEHVGEGVPDVCDCHTLLADSEGKDFDGVACELLKGELSKSGMALNLLKVNVVIAIA